MMEVLAVILTMFGAITAWALLDYVARRAVWLLRPNHGPVKIEGKWATRRQLIVKLRRASVARTWIENPPKLNVNGLEGLVWLTKQGDPSSRGILFEQILGSDPVFSMICTEIQDRHAFENELLEIIGGRPPL
jgi:hypothetical protein